ncbi:uncharacterized protein LOC114272545 [Camellia sinensis]|uniref:uncharacterized protein LOC114272545 n=1 Tax=Camellia sinensis TaxID=4442 RepID=UPI0010360B4A|nr:uncharacterized protein LOC114272545 [Camellia sinensis]
MTVVEYEAKFTKLARFALHMVNTDYKNGRKFDGSLCNDILERVNVLKLPTYVDVLDQALMSKTNMGNENKSSEWKGKRQGFFSKKKIFKKQSTGSSSSSSSRDSAPTCNICGRKHRGVCYHTFGACFWCGKTGHMVKDCPQNDQKGGRLFAISTGYIPVPGNTVRPTATKDIMRQGRVFALIPGDTWNTEVVVSGTISTCNQDTFVLIDSGSTHSFVSTIVASRLNRPLESLPYLLCVSIPSRESVSCAFVYRICDMRIGNATLYVDLLPLDIRHFDVILGMDWLSKYYATINCVTKRVMFRPLRHEEFEFVDSFSVHRDFLDVFPDELPGELVDREIEFTSDVVPGIQPISKSPLQNVYC